MPPHVGVQPPPSVTNARVYSFTPVASALAIRSNAGLRTCRRTGRSPRPALGDAGTASSVASAVFVNRNAPPAATAAAATAPIALFLPLILRRCVLIACLPSLPFVGEVAAAR